VAEWLVAKYMRDLRRREPRNVGVVVFANNETRMRFLGQRPDGSINARHAAVGEPEVYRGWIDYWRYLAATHVEQAGWVQQRPFENYWLERGGALLSADDVDPDLLLHDLYADLVEETETGDWRLADQISRLIEEAGLSRSEHFHRNFTIRAERTGESYDYPYAYVNDHRAVAAQIHQIGPNNARSRLWEFTNLSPDIRKIVFTTRTSDDRSVELLQSKADVVDATVVTPAHVRELFLSPAPSRPRSLLG
jgi:hypothetical protein